MTNETIVLKFLHDNYEETQKPVILEHNFSGLNEYKPGRHVNRSYIYGHKAERNRELEPNTLRIKE